MKKLLRIAWKNRLYVALAVFLFTMNFIMFLADRGTEQAGAGSGTAAVERTDPAAGMSMFDPESVKAREEKVRQLAARNPVLYLFLGLLNMAMLFALFVGLLLDGYFLARFFRKKPLDIRTAFRETPRWNIADIIRVSLIFLSFGYVFVILQSFATAFLPILLNDNFRMVFNTALMNVVGISVIFHFVIIKYGHSMEAVGLTSKNFAGNVCYAGIGYISLIPVLAAIMILTFFVVNWLKYHPPVQPIVQVLMKEKGTGILWLAAVFAAVFGPVAEEIFFRGFMYSALRKTFGVFRALIITSVIFSVLHAHIVGFLPIMALGILLAYLYEKTGSLVPCISVHILHNLAMIILVFLVRQIGP